MHDFLLDGAALLFADTASNDSRELMSRAAGQAMSLRPNEVIVRKHCRHCGSSDHGRPIIETTGVSARTCSVSFSRSEGYSVAAARAGPPIGVDIESVRRVSMHPVDEVLLHPEERQRISRLSNAAALHHLASLWVAKEAVVKSTGDGLRIDLTQILIRIDGTSGAVQSWPSTLALIIPPQVTLFAVS